MSIPRQQDSAECKAGVALEALTGLKTVNELARTFGGHPTPLAHGTHRLPKERPDLVSVRRDQRERDQEACHAQGYQPLGPRKVALDWLTQPAGRAS